MGAQGIIEMEGKKTKIYNIKVTFDVKLSPFRLYLEMCVIIVTFCKLKLTSHSANEDNVIFGNLLASRIHS